MRQDIAFKEPHDDLLEEWLVCFAVIAYWRTDTDTGEALIRLFF